MMYKWEEREREISNMGNYTGDADGLGETRKKELVKSGMLLGLRSEDDVFVVNDPYVRKPHTPILHTHLKERKEKTTNH